MPIETICEGCGRGLRVPDEHAGKQARCPQCGTIYVVPASSELSASERADQDSSSSGGPGDGVTDDGMTGGDVDGDIERWQVRTPDGQVYGPVPKIELDQWYSEGRISREASLFRDSDGQWHPAAEIYPQLAETRENDRGGQSPFAAQPRARHAHARPRRRQLSHRGGTILTLGVLGWFLCPVFAPIAWSMGAGDLRSMRLGLMDPAGESLTRTGMVLGMIQTILVGIICVIVCLGGFR